MCLLEGILNINVKDEQLGDPLGAVTAWTMAARRGREKGDMAIISHTSHVSSSFVYFGPQPHSVTETASTLIVQFDVRVVGG